MVDRYLCSKIISIGPSFKNPRGGISQILYYYDTYIFSDFNVIINSGRGFATNIYLLIKSILQLLWLFITNRNITIVHIHTASNNSFIRSSIFQKLAKLFGKHTIMHIHGGGFKNYYDNGHKRFVRSILKSCDAVIALTDNWKQIFCRDLGIDNIYYVHNVIPKPDINKISVDDKVHFLFMGLIAESKGIFDFISALGSINNDVRKKVYLHVAGNGDIKRLQNTIDKYSLNDIVKYEGWVIGEQKQNLLNLCQVLVLPSYIEALSLSILEGLSYNMSVLASNIGGIPSIVKDHYNGLLFNPGDTKAMAKCVETIVNDDTLRETMEKNSANIVQDFYSENVANELTHLYSLLNNK